MEILYSGHFSYSAATASPRIPAGRCILDIVRYCNGVCGVMITEVRNNRGPSVTNFCDRIATQVYNAYLSNTSVDRTVWLGHCPKSKNHKGYIDLVQFSHEPGLLFTRPQWKRFFESPLLSPQEFMRAYSFILKELCTTYMVFAVVDKKGYYWRVWANNSGFFVISSNPSVMPIKELLDIRGVAAAFNDNRHFLGVPEIEKRFTNALMKGFLNGRL